MTAPFQRSFLSPAGHGSQHPRWRGGVSLSWKGYRRITHGPHRFKYEHRRIMECMLEHPWCASYVFPNKGEIPKGFTVEHMDHCRTHNCPENLMLLDERIHNAITQAGCRYIREHYSEWLALQFEAESTPEWVNQ